MHEVAQSANPGARVVYVDYDPVVVAHGRAILADNANVTMIPGNLLMSQDVLENSKMRDMIYFGEPVVILLAAVLHFLDDRNSPAALVDDFKRVISPGSYLALSHCTADYISDDERREGQAVYAQASALLIPRSYSEVAKFFDGTVILEPDLVSVSHWRKEARFRSGRTLVYGGIGRKP